MTEAIIAIVAALVAAGLTFALLRTLDRLRRKDAETEAQRILAQANQDAANRLRTAELEIKEKTLQQKAESEKESSKLREELRERERILDKREETLTQQADDVQKQERIVEATQRRLTEKVESFNRRNEELASVVERANRVIRQIFESEKYDLILQEVVFAGPRVDITDKVIRVLNAAPAPGGK